MVNSADFPGGVYGLRSRPRSSLSLGAAPNFGAFVAGRGARVHGDEPPGNVISTAGNATLSVSDPSTTNTGKLVNGGFTLANPLMASATGHGRHGGGGRSRAVSAAPTTLLTYAAPVSNSALTLTFKQTIGANEHAADGQLQQDADVHPVDNRPVLSTWSGCAPRTGGAHPAVETTQRARSHQPLRFSISLPQGP